MRHRILGALIVVVVAVLVPSASGPAQAVTGGPDAGGYTYTDSNTPGGPAGGPFQSIIPAYGGTGAPIPNPRFENVAIPYTLPFPINLYGETSSRVWAGLDGNLQLVNVVPPIFPPGFLPDPKFDSAIDGYAGFTYYACDNCGIYVQVTGAVGHRTATFEWRSNIGPSDFGVPSDFQILVHEDREDVDLRYLEVAPNPGEANQTTVGIQGGDGSLGRYLEYAGEPTRGLAIRFSRPSSTSTTTTLSTRPAGESVFGQAVTLTARVAPFLPTGKVPTGTVTFTDGSGFYPGAGVLGSVPVGANGYAQLTTTRLATDNHRITARYSGSGSFRSSQNRTLIEVHPAQVATTIPGPSVRVLKQGSAHGIVATVSTLAPGSGIPPGYVGWSDANGEEVARTPLAKGVTTLPTAALPPGRYRLTAGYEGYRRTDDDYGGAAGGTATVVLLVVAR